MFFNKLKMSNIFILILLISSNLVFFKVPVEKVGSYTNFSPTDIYIFYGEGCPHCAALETYLEAKQHFQMKINYIEVWKNNKNQEIFKSVLKDLQIQEQDTGVPMILSGEKYHLGYNPGESSEREVEKFLLSNKKESVKQSIYEILSGADVSDLNVAKVAKNKENFMLSLIGFGCFILVMCMINVFIQKIKYKDS